jgi:hypothetical protein
VKNKSINAEHHQNCEEWKPKSIMYKQQTTSKTERKQKREHCGFTPRPMVTNGLLVLALSVSPNLHDHPTTR